MSAKILIIEDERDLAQVLKAKLSSAGYRCAVLTNADKAFEIVRSRKPDLVITDVMMPKVSGFELCRKIRMDPLMYATPVLMLSAMSEKPEIQHAFDQGANDYIVKPFDPGDLLQRVRDLLGYKKELDAVNPVTGLPGKGHMQQVLMNKIFRGEKIGLLHFSFAHSSAYGTAYGHERRDEAVAKVAEMIPDSAKAAHALEVYTGHLGHFDFLICCNAPDANKFAETLSRRFDLLKAVLYEKADVERGAVMVKSGKQPLMHPVISIVTNADREFTAPQMIKIAMALSRRVPENGSTKIITTKDALIV